MFTRRFLGTSCLILLVLSSVPASAQVMLAGNWIPYRTHEDEQDRGPGPDLGPNETLVFVVDLVALG